MTLRRGARPRLTRMSLTLLDLTWCMVVSCTDDWKSLRWDSERASVAGAEIERDQIATRRLLSRSDMRGLALPSCLSTIIASTASSYIPTLPPTLSLVLLLTLPGRHPIIQLDLYPGFLQSVFTVSVVTAPRPIALITSAIHPIPTVVY
jgi:hypothetical protein